MACSCVSNLTQMVEPFSDLTTSQAPSNEFQQQHACDLSAVLSSAGHPPTRPRKSSNPYLRLTRSNNNLRISSPSAVASCVPPHILVQQAQLRKVAERARELGWDQLPPRRSRMPKLLALLDQVYEQHGAADEQHGKAAGTPSAHGPQTATVLVAPSTPVLPATETVDNEHVPDLSLLFDRASTDSEAAANAPFDAVADDNVRPVAAVKIAVSSNHLQARATVARTGPVL